MCKGPAKGYAECCAVFRELCSKGTLISFPEKLCELPKNIQPKLCAHACYGADNVECCAVCERDCGDEHLDAWSMCPWAACCT